MGLFILVFQDTIAYACFESLEYIRPESGKTAIAHAKTYFEIRIWAAPATLLWAFAGPGRRTRRSDLLQVVDED